MRSDCCPVACETEYEEEQLAVIAEAPNPQHSQAAKKTEIREGATCNGRDSVATQSPAPRAVRETANGNSRLALFSGAQFENTVEALEGVIGDR
jgi:hypothetical protein